MRTDAEHVALQPRRVGRCCCGSLTVQTTGEPELIGACSCQECQRRTGSVLSVSAYWLRKHVCPAGPAMRYQRPAQSGSPVVFYFCPTCGSTVYWELPGLRPDWFGIAAGAFTEPDFPPPSISVWEAFRHAWIDIPAKSHFETQPGSADGVSVDASAVASP